MVDQAEMKLRPRELSYNLDVGQLGYWPVVAAVPADMRPGDRVSFEGDTFGDIVTEVVADASTAVKIAFRTTEGRMFFVGRMARGFRLDRWGTGAKLSWRGTR